MSVATDKVGKEITHANSYMYQQNTKQRKTGFPNMTWFCCVGWKQTDELFIYRNG